MPETREEMNARKKRERDARRLRAIAQLGGECVVCGEWDPIVLEIDHLVGNILQEPHCNSHTQRAARGLTAGLQLLCSNCHTVKTKLGMDLTQAWADSRSKLSKFRTIVPS